MSHAIECKCGRAYRVSIDADGGSIDIERLTFDHPDGSIVRREDYEACIMSAVQATREADRRRGHPPILSDEVVAIAREAITQGASMAQVARALGCSYNTLYRRIGPGVAQLGRRHKIDKVPDDMVPRMLQGSRNLSPAASIPPPYTPHDYGEARAEEVLYQDAELNIDAKRHARVLESWLSRRIDERGLRTTDQNAYWLVAFECGASRATTAAVLREEVIADLASNQEPVATSRRLGISLGAVLRARGDKDAPSADGDDIRNRTVDGIDPVQSGA